MWSALVSILFLSTSMVNAVVSVVIDVFYLPEWLMLWSALLSLLLCLSAWLMLWSALVFRLFLSTSMDNAVVSVVIAVVCIYQHG